MSALAMFVTLVLARPALSQIDDSPFMNGQDFAGLDLPVDPQPGDAIIEARGGWTWTEGESRRLLLTGDVRVRIGVYTLVADRASVWIEPRERNGQRVWQLAIYFDNVRTPLASATFAQDARRLLVTAAVQGSVRLRIALLEPDRPQDDGFLQEAESRLSRRLQTLMGQGAPVNPSTQYSDLDRSFYEATGGPAPLDPDAPIFPKNGVVTFQAPNRTFITGEDENTLVVTGGVVVQYTDLDANRTLQLTAQNAVVFLDPGSVADVITTGPGEVHGIYLEGNVIATDGDFTVRGPRVYYDVKNDRAALLDAVFYTYDAKLGMPLYVRAKVVRQEAKGQWAANNATISNVGFAEPRLAIGARSVHITQTRLPNGSTRPILDARRMSLRLGHTPFFPLPRQRGEFNSTTLPEVKIGTKDGNGVLRTRWNFNSLLGLDSSNHIEGDVLLDAFFKRGPGGGVNLAWNTPDAFGTLLAYYIHDTGTDRLTTGANIAPPQNNRGLILATHQTKLSDHWKLALELSYISDESFVDAFFEPIAETGRETTSRLALERRSDQGLLIAQAQGTFNDFTPNEYLLQSRGYQTQRLPELSYRRVGDSFLGGKVNYFGETSAGILKFNFVEPAIKRFGFVSNALAQAGFGLSPDQSLGEALRSRGLREQSVARFDTRHEFTATLDAGPVRITPFVVGRLTAYGDDFKEFRAAIGSNEDSQNRAYAAAGATFSTSINRVYNSVESSLLDLHRLRHIIEPSATVWAAASSVDARTLPVFDESVESISDGAAFRVGVTSTLQTQRGGPGAWRNVNWLVLRAEYVYATEDTTRDAAIGRFFQSRPELSQFGRFAAGEASLQLTDAIGVVGSATYDTENSTLDTASVGLLIDHGFGFTTFAELRRIDADVIDSTFFNFGASYELNARYAIASTGSIDLENSSFQNLGFEVRRRFPQWTLQVGLDYDDTRSDVALNIQIRPFGGPTDRVRNSLSRDRFTSSLRPRGTLGSPYQR